jgi:hypothetical protein
VIPHIPEELTDENVKPLLAAMLYCERMEAVANLSIVERYNVRQKAEPRIVWGADWSDFIADAEQTGSVILVPCPDP